MKRDSEEMGDAMKSLENRTLDSKREMDILATLDEMKSMRVLYLCQNLNIIFVSIVFSPLQMSVSCLFI